VFVVGCAKLANLEPTSGTGAATPADLRDAGGLPETAEKITTTFSDIDRPVPCGQPTEFRYVVLTSANTNEVDYALEVPEGSPFALRVEGGATGRVVEGKIPPTGEVKIYVRVASPRPGPVGGDLFVRTGATRQRAELAINVLGGSLSLKPALLDFGEVRRETDSAPQPIVLTNTGTERVTITAWSPNGADFTFAPSGLSIEPGENATMQATLRAGPAGPPLELGFTPTATTPLCEGAPSLTLRATRVNQDVTVNPATVDFGNVDCNAAASPRTVTITNHGNQNASFDVALPGGDTSWFTVSTTGGTVPKAMGPNPGTTSFTIGIKPGADLTRRSETINVTITSPDQGTKTVTATVQRRGAVLEVTAASGQPFPLTFTAANQTKQYLVRNVGNDGVRVRATSTSAAFSPEDPPYQLSFPSFPVSVNVRSNSDGNATGFINFVRTDNLLPPSGALCNTPTVPVKTQF